MKYIIRTLFLSIIFSSCNGGYSIKFTSNKNEIAENQTVYLKELVDDKWICIDSTIIKENSFEFVGEIKEPKIVNIYIEEYSIMPVVIERGEINIKHRNNNLIAEGTKLNNELYNFIGKRNAIENALRNLYKTEIKMSFEGEDPEYIREVISHKDDSLTKEKETLIKDFFKDNYTNILGPNVFIMLSQLLPYPQVTPLMDEVLKEAPKSFKNHPYVKEYLKAALENSKCLGNGF